MGIYIYNSEQISRIQDACRVTADVLNQLRPMIIEGVSTWELDRFARNYITQQGGVPAFLGYQGFPAALCTSINEQVVHGIPGKKAKLKSGDIIGIDVGVLMRGYYGDAAATYEVGKVSETARVLIQATRESLYRGIENCVDGGRISDISHAVEEHVKGFGFSPVRDFVGHGIGMKLHEEPAIPNFGLPGRGSRIANGMVFAIEPMINVGTPEVSVLSDGWTVVTKDGKLSAHFEHTIAVLEGKAVVMTESGFY